MRISIGKLALLLSASVASAAAQEGSPLQVKTETGIVEGKMQGSLRAFLGIPYAAPPVGELRWKAPAPPLAWEGVRDATKFGARCMQGNIFGDMVFRDAGPSEDCLMLNVWTPANVAKKKLPVMVWIHGGGFVAGATSEPRQDGATLAEQGVAVVSMNYRMGIFGFFELPELIKDSGKNAAGNYGLLDQVAALEWVKKNIAAFGGDPGNVTIFGESAGSFSVSELMASPLAKGLFERAIGADKLLETVSKPGSERRGPNMVAVDGYFLPKSVAEIFAAGTQNDVPLLAGWNRDEGSGAVLSAKPPLTAASVKELGEKEFKDNSAEFFKLYPASDDATAVRSWEDFAGDRFIAFGTWKWIEAEAKTGKSPIYRYRFDQAPPDDPSREPGMGAFHSSEIEYVFGTLEWRIPTLWKSEDKALSELMRKYWANFARTGNPNGAGLPQWPAYKPGGDAQVMHLSGQSKAAKDEQRGRYEFLKRTWGK